MNRIIIPAAVLSLLSAISLSVPAAQLEWASLTGGTVPGTTIGYSMASNSNDDRATGAGGTKDGEYTWEAGGTTLLRTGGDWSATITFSSPVPADQLTFVFNDVDVAGAVITLSVVGTANPQDFAIDPGFSMRPDFDYDPQTGQLTSPPDILDNTSQLFGTSGKTVASMSLATAGLGGDWTSALFGFVAPDTPSEPPPTSAAIPTLGQWSVLILAGLLTLLGFKGLLRIRH